jgi:hypothetical protein
VGDLAGDDRYPIELHLPPAHQAGVYANRLIVWHTVTEFTLDFAVAEPQGHPIPTTRPRP